MYRGYLLGFLTFALLSLACDVLVKQPKPSPDATCVPLYDRTGLECCQ